MAHASRRFLVWRRVVPLLSVVLCLSAVSILLLRVPASEALSARAEVAAQPPDAAVGAAGAAAGSVSGQVTNQHGVPQQFVRVAVSQSTLTTGCVEPIKAQTEADGTYVINNVPIGTYKVLFESCDFLFHDVQYFDHSATYTSATQITVQPGSDRPDTNATMTGHSVITGSVKNLANVGIPDIMVLVCDPAFTAQCVGSNWAFGNFAYTDANGNYALDQMKAGSYKLLFQDTSPVPVYLSEYYNNALDWENAISVTVGVEASVGNINATLTRASTIAGVVKDEGGAGIQNAHLNFTAVDGSRSFGHTTIGGGAYQTRVMAAGVYTITVTGPAGDDTYLSKQVTYTVQEGIDHTGVEFVLPTARHISGTVTAESGGAPIPNLFVGACLVASGCTTIFDFQNAMAATDANGDYHIAGLAPGAYALIFSVVSSAYLAELHDNIGGFLSASTVNLTGATLLDLNSTVVADVDAQLGKAPTLSGQVTKSIGGGALAGITATICRVVGADCPSLDSRTTDAGGLYSFGNLQPGSYRVRFTDDAASIYLEQFSAPIALSAGQDATLNIQMVRAARISGMLTLPDGVTPAVGARARPCQVAINDCTPLPQLEGTASITGFYTMDGLRNGVAYRVEILSPGIDYVNYFIGSGGSVFRWQDASDFILTAEEQRDFGTLRMVRAATISGRVVNAAGNPLAGITVKPCMINLGDPCTIGGHAQTNANGEYTIRGLRPTPAANIYYVRFEDGSGVYKNLYYSGAAEIIDGTPLTLALGENRTGINMVLPLVSTVATPSPTPGQTGTPSPTPQPSATPNGTPSATPSPTPPPTVVATLVVQPNTPTQITIGEAQGLEAGQSIKIEVPVGAVEVPTTFSIGILDTPQPLPTGLGRMLFAISATQGGAPTQRLQFGAPITLTIVYRDLDVAGLDEENLTLRYHDGAANVWLEDGISVISQDRQANRLVVTIAHLTTFALAESGEQYLLPLVTR